MSIKEGPFTRVGVIQERKIFEVGRRYLESATQQKFFIGSCDNNEDNCPEQNYTFKYMAATLKAKAVVVIYDDLRRFVKDVDLEIIPSINLGKLEWTTTTGSYFYTPSKRTVDVRNFLSDKFISTPVCCFDQVDRKYRLAARVDQSANDVVKNKSLIGAKVEIDRKIWQLIEVPDYEVDSSDDTKSSIDAVFVSPPIL